MKRKGGRKEGKLTNRSKYIDSSHKSFTWQMFFTYCSISDTGQGTCDAMISKTLSLLTL